MFYQQTFSSSRIQRVKKFQTRVVNRSCADLLFYDKLADLLLECCSAQARPNTLSLLSLIPLIVCNCVVQAQWWGCILAMICFLLHQVFDIANKKQAYRLSQFTLTTYYLDHLYDSISCIQIVDITGKLLLLQNQTRITCMFFFGMLPFFTHHLAMYANGYLTFYTFSPAVEGILILQILFMVLAFVPDLPTYVVIHFKISEIIIFLSLIWLIIFLIADLRTITQAKQILQTGNGNNDDIPLKNLFVIGIFGYIILEMTSIQPQLLSNCLYFYLLTTVLTILFSNLISQLILAYGYVEKLKQFTLNILGIFFLIVTYYSVCGLANFDNETELLIGQTIMGVLIIIELIYFFYYNYQNVKYLNGIIKSE